MSSGIQLPWTWPDTRSLDIGAFARAVKSAAQRVETAGLAQRLRERDCPGNRDIQRARSAPYRDPHPRIGPLMHEIGNTGAFTAEQQRVAGGEREMMQYLAAARRQQHEAGTGVAPSEKGGP